MRSGMIALLLMAGCSTPPAQHHTIVIEQMQFKPASLTIHKGDAVTFINRDMVMHNIKDMEGINWIDSLPAGDSSSITITTSAGYFCSLHPVMKGRITVQ